jgi:hypothetical protein
MPDSALPKHASHWATRVMDMKSFQGDTLLSWPDHIARSDAGTARISLAQHNGA